MPDSKPPRSFDVCAQCPNPDLEAKSIMHFGSMAWEFHCNLAQEVHVSGKGITVDCGAADSPCCVDNGKTVFVNSPRISPLRSFLDTTLKYFKT